MKSFIWLPIFFMLIVVGLSRADDFYVTEYPKAYNLLNSYQQKVTTADKQQFSQNSAWRVLQKQMLLSDGFTRVMKVEAVGLVWYFVLDAEGNPLKLTASRERFFKNGSPLTDTLQVVRQKAVLFSEDAQNPKKGKRDYLLPAEKLVRVFRWQGLDFARPLSANRFGWLTVLNKKGLKRVAHLVISGQLVNDSTRIYKNIDIKIRETNKIYKKVFGLLNKHFSENLSTPGWKIIQQAAGWNVVFTPPEVNGAFPLSRHYFNEKIRGALWNAGYLLNDEKGLLRIRWEKSNEK